MHPHLYGCCLVSVTHKRGRPTPGLASTMAVTNVDFGNGLLKCLLHEFVVTDVE
jgi:hypothetical protein